MPLFDYVGINRNGRRISGRIEGAGQRTVISKLARQGVFPSRIDEVKSRATGAGSSLFPWRKKIAITELAGVIRQMATLVVAGIPLDEVLATISQQSGHSHLHRTFSALRENVLQGDALHQAMKQYPESFPDILVNMVQIGEDSGALDQVLMSLAEYFEDQSQVRSKIKSAFAYPLLMALVGSGVLFFMFAFVIPKITRMFTEMEKALPWSTRALIGISGFFSNWWWLPLTGSRSGSFLTNR